MDPIYLGASGPKKRKDSMLSAGCGKASRSLRRHSCWQASLDVPELVLHKGAQLVHLQSKASDVEHDGEDVDALRMPFQLHRALYEFLHGDVTTLQTQHSRKS